jgi:hypothetical protein
LFLNFPEVVVGELIIALLGWPIKEMKVEL